MLNKKYVIKTVYFFLICVGVIAHAQSTYFSESNKTILRLGAQGTYFYVSFNEAMLTNCLWGNLYIAAEQKGLYTQLLAAKLTGRRLSRVDYSQPGGNGTQCNVAIVEITD